MYELIQLTEHDFYVDCPSKMGIVLVGDGEAVMIDSGSDKDAGKKAYRHLQDRGWTLKAIFNTHSHGDHIGGNRFLQEKTGCAVYANGLEAAYTADTLLEPIGLWGGLPFSDLRHKFLMAQESRAGALTPAVLPAGFSVIPLPGHSFDMVGFLTPDRTAYIADSVCSAETLQKYGITFLWHPGKTLETLDFLPTLNAARFVPAHAPVTDDVRPLCELNKQAVAEVERVLCGLLRQPMTAEALLREVFTTYGLTMNAQQFVLIGSTVRSYLAALHDEGRVTFTFEGNEMLWHSVE